MSRCLYCNYCDTTDIAEGAVSLRWDESISGFVCSLCEDEVYDALSEFEEDEEEDGE